MNIAIIIILLLFALAIVELIWFKGKLALQNSTILYVWTAALVLATVYYFRSLDFDFALLLVLATGITGFVALIDKLFLRKSRIAEAQLQSDQQNVEQTQTNLELPKAYKEPVLVEYARSFFPVLILVLVLRSFVFEPFRIPSGSMYPTLEVGDFIVVSKFSYGLRLPVTNTKIIPISEPKRGDVMVFKYPEDPRINYIKRVIGLPGDKIEYRNKVLYINGAPQDVDDKGLFSYRSSYRGVVNTRRFTESFGETSHDILINDQVPARNGEWRVPEGHYFVMGDNRDDSRDSRYWEFLPEKNLVGKAKYIWLHLDIGGTGFKASRIGTEIK